MSMTAHIGGAVPKWTLGNRLWRARSYAELTQQELATRIGVGLRAVKEGEADVKPPKEWVLIAWALACGVDPDWLKTGHPAPQRPDSGPGQVTDMSGWMRGSHSKAA